MHEEYVLWIYRKLDTQTVHGLAENEQCRHRPLRNYVLRNYVHRTLIPSTRRQSSLIAARRQLTTRSEITVWSLWCVYRTRNCRDRIISRFCVNSLPISQVLFWIDILLFQSTIYRPKFIGRFKLQIKREKLDYKTSIEQKYLLYQKVDREREGGEFTSTLRERML